MRRLAVSLSKGGVGKSTSAVNLAAGLARAGASVLLVDTDTQGQLSSMLGVKPEAGLAELVLGQRSPEEAIVQVRDGLWLLAGGRALAGVTAQITRKEFGGEQTLSEALAFLDDRYNFLIMDTAPGWSSMTINVLFYAQEVLAPVSLEVLTLHGLLEFEKSLTSIQRYNKALALRYVLPTFLDLRVKKSQEILQQLQAHYGEKACSPIRYNVRLSEAPGFGQTIYEYAPGSTGAQDYQRLTERILQDGR